MLSLTQLRLRLVDPARNRDRAYELVIDEDLLGDVTVRVRFGRFGRALRDVVHLARDRSDADRIAGRILRRRLSARRRLGSAYLLTAAEGDCRGLLRHWHALGGADGRPTVTPIVRRSNRRAIPSPVELPLFAA